MTDTSAGFFRVHTADRAYLTQQPRGLFTAIGRLVDAKTMTEDEIGEYWQNRTWFEAHLPVPSFYDDGNSIRAITWYKNNPAGRSMLERMGFYRRMAERYGLALFMTTTELVPGTLVYEDLYQVGVVDSRHDGPGFCTLPFSLTHS